MHAVMVQFTCQDSTTDVSWLLADSISGLESVDGLLSSTWFADDDVHGRFVVFSDQAAADAYLNSAAFDAVVLNPAFARLRIQHFDVIEHVPTAASLSEARAAAILLDR